MANDNDIEKNVERVREGAKKIGDADFTKVINNSDKIVKKCSGGVLKRFIENIKLFISMVKDYWNKNYREVPWWAISAIVFALVYVFSPIDAIPDWIPVFGLLDDAGVVAACLKLTEEELLKYKEWKGNT